VATTYGYYEHITLSGRRRNLCFACAVRVLMIDHKENRIAFKSDGYEFHQCAACDNFIEDRVEI